MTGQLVIAELGAFRLILQGAAASDGEKVKLWSRSTISNAMHRVGPTAPMKTAAEHASREIDAFATSLSCGTSETTGRLRARAIESLDRLMAAVHATKAVDAPQIEST